MKKLVFTVVILLLLSSLAFGKEKVILVTGEWVPYTGEKMQGYGFFTEIVTAVLEEMEIAFEYQFYPWRRSEHRVKSGEVFAAFPYYKTKDRESDFYFSDAVVNSCSRFFFLKSKFKQEITWETLDDFKDYIIGGALGNWYEPVFKSAGLKVEYASTDEVSFRKLMLGRVDILPTDELVGWELIRKLFPEQIADFDTVKKPIKEDSLHLLVSKEYEGAVELKEKFNMSLKRIKEKNIYAEILKKYNIRESTTRPQGAGLAD